MYREWCRNNPDAKKAHDATRRERKANTEGSFTREEFTALCEQFSYHCAYCGKYFEKLATDHVIPLSRGGTDYIENIVPACTRCNSRKGNKTPEEFAAMLGGETHGR